MSDSGLAGTVMGTKGVSDVKAKATSVYNAYNKLVDVYATARGDVKTVMDDFVTIRGDVAKVYLEYAAKLTDVFGDSIKKVAPEFFDFDAWSS